MDFLRNIPQYLKDVRFELRKVNWPSREETIKYTIIVVGLSAALAALLGAFDFIYVQILERFVF
ncbi:MAG: preprotein translocase subunit SecE [Parcubacteria group bacterium]|nr:preprotein translocase subunit SecE [Parcubacteria group bacterium]